MSSSDVAEGRTHILGELGFAARQVGDELHGTASIIPEMYVPETSSLRISVLAAWTDTLAGLLAVGAMRPRVPVTLELDVHLCRPIPASGEIRGVGRTLKSGRSVFAASVEFRSDDGELLAFGGGSFMAAGDPAARLPDKLSLDLPASATRLSLPLAQRAGCERGQPGVAVLPRSDDGLNSSNTVNGGLIALVAEEAALSLAPGDTLCSLALRYLQPVRVGPLVATACAYQNLAQVEFRDAGNEHRLSAVATTRSFDR